MPGTSAAHAGAVRQPAGAIRPLLLDLLDDEERVRAIGTAYRALRPEEDHPNIPAMAVAAGKAPSSQHVPGIRPHWCDAFAREDFEADRTVLIDGWVLSVTEARECALWSICNP